MENRKQQTNELVSHRTFNVQYRADDDGQKKIGGMAAMYDKYTNMGYFIEVIRRGFFDGIDTTETACLKNHDPNLVLGRTANGTLKLTATADGLDYEAVLPNTTIGNDTYEEIKSGYLYKSSFAFTVAESSWKKVKRSELTGLVSESDLDAVSYGGEVEIRELLKGDRLYDVSPVTYPAYQDTSVGKREAELLKEERGRFIKEDRAGETVETETDKVTVSGADLLLALENAETKEETNETQETTEIETKEEKANSDNGLSLRLRLARARSL